MAGEDIFASVSQTPAVQSLARRLELGGALSLAGISRAAQPFFAALIRCLFPRRAIVVVTDGVKTQERFHQDVETWLGVEANELSQASVGRTCRSAASDSGADGNSSVGPSNPPVVDRPARLLFYPAWETLPHEAKLPHADVMSERLETLVALSTRAGLNSPNAQLPGSPKRSDGGSTLIITHVAALLQRTFPPGLIENRTRLLRRGDRLEPLDLIEWLEDQGYEPEAQVTQRGEIALRGGILDVYPLTSPWPVRLEFFGDELDSLRHFDPATQVSREQIETIILPPGGEIGILKRLLETSASPAESSAGQSTDAEPPTAQTTVPAGLALCTLADYLPPESIFLLCEPDELAEHADTYARQIPENDPFFVSWDDVREQLAARKITILSICEDEASGPAQMIAPEESEVHASALDDPLRITDYELRSLNTQLPTLNFSSLDAFRPLAERAPEPQIAEAQRREFFHQLHRWLRQGSAVHVFCNNDGERQRFSEIWNEYGLDEPGHRSADSLSACSSASDLEARGQAVCAPISTLNSQARQSEAVAQLSTLNSQPSTHLGALSRGFLYEPAKIVVVTDAEIFGRYKVQRPRRLKSPHAIAARSALDIDFTDLEEGDYVVHLQHGIGRYHGLKFLPPGLGRKNVSSPAAPAECGEECLVIEYAASHSDQPPPKLYVPVTEAHLVSKYVGAGKARPSLNTLGGGRWAKTKAQAEEAVRDLASELLAVQAARDSQPGHAFPPDTPWQREFESAFLYEETPDQMRSILETKRDLETPRPMDRLICGDVGYGKTEVAIRAAFKAVMDGRQVAILVPTTILAQQHFNTFRERMADYPIRVEQLSRFCSRRDQRRIVEQLAEGSVDIVIGTHRLLQGDITFKDLGLVVIDEEQRFGVLHKEKLKLLRKLVDVLTLSATPIPRTLYLALTGARDMSTIETPPQDRLPVETVVAQYDERLIRDAIQRELNREGQVYYLHNRVTDIESVALRIGTLVPNARLVVGHGQMENEALEDVMAKFINGEADVLVSTTIIESGIDIPNANTIIIDRADRFGLSDLYQLRGRVGRYKHQAYAYLLLPRHAALLSDVRKRISAIKQYSSLGSGFKIAMRDLEIRGAGNLLGSEQSGHITAVGFELYCQLLKQSVSALKGEKVKPRVEVQVRLEFLALSPADEASRASSDDGESEARGRPSRGRGGKREFGINVPREVARYSDDAADSPSPSSIGRRPSAVAKASAYIPFKYIAEARQRIEIYRKLAQATDKPTLERLRGELRDRFGKLPAAMDLLLQVAELRILASERGVVAIETKEDKLMLTRNNDYLTVAGKFPRLTKRDAKGRLGEIKKLLLAL